MTRIYIWTGLSFEVLRRLDASRGGVGFLFFLYVESWHSSSFDMSAVFRFSQRNGAIFRLCRGFLICSWRQNNPAVSELLF